MPPQAPLLKERARAMRREPSPAERIVWSMLKRDRLGLRFRRQYPIGHYIVDFVCFEKRLIIEVDGSQHQLAQGYDGVRGAWLSSQGFRIVRFWNSQVFTDREDVCARIVHECLRR